MYVVLVPTSAAVTAAGRDLVAALVATGMDSDIPLAEEHMYDFVRTTARRQGHRRDPAAGEDRPTPHLSARPFTTRARWETNFGGVTANATITGLFRALLGSLLRSRDYSLVDIVRTVRGITASQAALLPQLVTTDLVRTMPRLDVPIVLAQGRLDQVAPGEAVLRLADRTRQAVGLVRRVGPHPAVRRTRQVPPATVRREGQSRQRLRDSRS